MNWTFKLKSILAFILIASVLTACKDKGDATWSDFKPLENLDKFAPAYFDATLGNNSKEKTENPAVYVDFSDGIVQAYSSSTNASIIQDLANKLVGSNAKVDWYGLGEKQYNGVGKINVTDARVLYNKVKDPVNYNDIMAPIETAIATIVKGKNDAILITDFEEYAKDGSEDNRGFAAAHFSQWLKDGNSIKFVYSSYTEKNKKSKKSTLKNLYFIVFTYGVPGAESLVTKFNEATSNRPYTIKAFDLNPNPYIISNNYGGVSISGFKNKTFIQSTKFYFNGWLSNKKSFEIIALNQPYNEEKLNKYIEKEIITEEGGNLISGLTLNAKNQSAYQLTKLKVTTSDVTEDYILFAKSDEAKKQKIGFKLDEKKNNVWDDNTSKNKIVQACYEKDSKNLKGDYVYLASKGKELHKNWDEFLDLDKSIFDAHLKNDPEHVELKLNMHSNYKFSEERKSDALIRVDLSIDDATSNVGNSQLEEFKWDSAISEGVKNISLYESIRSAIQEVKPNGIIYSYYIKFGYSKEKK